MREQFLEFGDKNEGPKSVVLVGVHGNETAGIRALEEILPDLETKRGVVWFGFGNPEAIEQNVRQIEANLNRLFKDESDLSPEELMSLEFRRAQEIKELLRGADALLDVHSSNTPDSTPFVISNSMDNEFVKHLPFDLVVTGIHELLPGGTDFFMHKLGKAAVTIECGFLGDESSIAKAKESIMSFLEIRGHIEGHSVRDFEPTQIHLFHQQRTVENFKPSKDFEDFEKLTKGQVIGTDGGKEIVAPEDCVILFGRERHEPNEEAFLLGRRIER